VGLLGSLLFGEPGGYGGGGGSSYGGGQGGMSVSPAPTGFGYQSSTQGLGDSRLGFAWGSPAAQWGGRIGTVASLVGVPAGSVLGRGVGAVIGGSGIDTRGPVPGRGLPIGMAGGTDAGGDTTGGPEADLGPSGGPEHESSDSESDKDSDKGT
jgi:hypothetical protein